MNRRRARPWRCLLLLAATGTLSSCGDRAGAVPEPTDQVLLLVQDDVALQDPAVTMWSDAASEEGFHLVPMHDSEFLSPLRGPHRYAGIILPDGVHKRADELLIRALRQFTQDGGSLMVVYDAGLFNLNDRYAGPKSRLSDMVGVDYALYDRLRDSTTAQDQVLATRPVWDALGVPPGKFGPAPLDERTDEPTYALSRYRERNLRYPMFVTDGPYRGQTLLRSGTGITAGLHQFGRGGVLFVDLPLGYLKGRTDGLLLHGFLAYFAGVLLHLPRLASVPEGIGGLVLNWHIDSNASLKPLARISTWELMHQGPYSVHFTAGPDARAGGDGLGLNIPDNPVSQEWVRRFKRRGDAIGSHGGWIHDYFGENVGDSNERTFEPFLRLNNEALERVTGRPVLEYSAPIGNQPAWVTGWLERHGVAAYYFTGNTGMGPTRGYRDGVRTADSIWAFPILHLGQAAAFEEMGQDGYTDAQVEQWLIAVTEFAAQHHSARLLYFHPPGILRYESVVRRWMNETARLASAGEFRWYTMSGLATFLNARLQVEWRSSVRGGRTIIEATHPTSLARQTWLLPENAYGQPTILEGRATVVPDSGVWKVIAGEGTRLTFQAPVRR